MRIYINNHIAVIHIYYVNCILYTYILYTYTYTIYINKENIMKVEEHYSSIIKDIRYKKIKSILESFFISKGSLLTSSFNKSMLISNQTNNESTKDITITDNSNHTLNTNSDKYSKLEKAILLITKGNNNNQYRSNSILSDYNIEKAIEEENEIEDSITISDFILRTAYLLIDTQNRIEKDKDNSKYYISNERYKKISDTIDLLHDEIFFYESTNIVENSYLSVSLQKIQHLPNGEYSFKLLLKEFNSQFNLMLHEKRILSNKKLMLLNPYEIINIYAMNFDKEDNTFPEVYLSQIHMLNFEKFLFFKRRIFEYWAKKLYQHIV